jgi:hypothetical protein
VLLRGLASSCLLAAVGSYAADKSDYKVGDRLPQKPPSAPGGYKELMWDALMPSNWNPAKEFQELDLANLSDSDPRAMKALEQLRSALDNAPVVSALNGTRVRIAGFTVPLESARGQISEFLLVPYFGACIHTPPPPANQIIHVTPVKPYKTEQAIEAVWVSGTLETVRSETGLGNAGYRLKAEVIAPYTR